jgi:hypothetical protein
VTDGRTTVAASLVYGFREAREDGSQRMVRTGDKGTQFGAPNRGKEAASRASRGRVCEEAGCGTVLSTYNAAHRCWMHEAPAFGHRFPGSNSYR